MKNAAERHSQGLPIFTEGHQDNADKGSGSLKSGMRAIERMLVESALQESHCNLQMVCGKLDITLSALYRKLNDPAIDLETYRSK